MSIRVNFLLKQINMKYISMTQLFFVSFQYKLISLAQNEMKMKFKKNEKKYYHHPIINLLRNIYLNYV